MKRKEAIKQIKEGKIQVENDLLPSTKEIEKFLKEAFPDDDYLEKNPNSHFIMRNYFYKDYDEFWHSSNGNTMNSLLIIKLSTITKNKKTKLSQLEKQFSELAKDVAELRQTLAKDVEVVVEEVKSELIVGEWYKNTKHGYMFIFDGNYKDSSQKGFKPNNEWSEELSSHKRHIDFLMRVAPQEVQAALENEAKKRGYSDKIGIKGLNFGEVWTNSGNIELKYDEKQNTLQMWSDFSETKLDGFKVNHRTKIDIFKDGIWAEIKEEDIDWEENQYLKINQTIYIYLGEHDDENCTVYSKSLKKYTCNPKGLFEKFKGELIIK